jgi:eukaryotic-like serine/threonine-protein kinase
MTRWETLEDLFARAVALEPTARDELLAGVDAELRAEVEAMIAATAPLAIERLAPGDARDAMIGRVIGRWRIVGVLGRGGMASVYRAARADGEYHQQGALKLVSPGSWRPEMVDRFRTERQVLAQLTHPNIARLVDGGLTDDGRPYLVMEIVDGAPITEWCTARRLAVADRLRLFRTVCEAVQHAHGMLVVHRDLKPANTFVTTAGEVKLLDFGIAKLLEPSAFGVDALATREPAPLTPEYAAPEQMFGGVITTATDVYSLGVLLYELLTGSRPYRLEGKSLVETEREIMSATVAPPSRQLGLRRGDDLDSIVLTALRAQPERRYTSAGQLGEDIGHYLDGLPVSARPDTLAYRARRFVGRNRAGVAAAVAFAVSLAAFGVIATWQARRAAEERDAAQLERDKAEKVVGLLVDLFERSNPNIRPDGDKMSIRQFLAKSEPVVLEKLDDQPLVRARMRQVFGLIHEARDEPAEARAAFQRALYEQLPLVGPDDPDAIESLYQLGVLREGAGESERAGVLLFDALDRSVRVFGENDDRTARTLLALAQVALDNRNNAAWLDKAPGFIERAYAIRRRVLPPDHPHLADTLGVLAQYHAAKGDTTRARQLYSEALAMFRTPEERRNKTAIELLYYYGELLSGIGVFDESLALQRESIELSKSVYGADSLPVAERLHDLATTLMFSGRNVDGDRVFRDSYERVRAALGEHHWKAYNIQRDIAWNLALEERYDEALDWIDRSIAAIATAPGNNNAGTLHHMHGRRAIILLRLGRSSEAVAALESTLAAAKKADPPDRGYIVADLEIELAIALVDTGRAAEAEPFARAGLAGSGEMSWMPPYAQCVLGWVLVLDGRVDEGRKLLGEALPAYRKTGVAQRPLLTAFERVLAP